METPLVVQNSNSPTVNRMPQKSSTNLDPLDRFKSAAQEIKRALPKMDLSQLESKHEASTIKLLDEYNLRNESKIGILEEEKCAHFGRKRSFLKKVWCKIKQFYRIFKLKHLGFIFILIAYSFFGGWLFSFCELENELKIKKGKILLLESEARNLTAILYDLIGQTPNLKMELEKAIIKYQIMKEMYPENRTTWDLWGGMFFAGTVYTTIGYGHYAPVTLHGRIAVMLYALIGIPLLLALLADFGEILTQFLNQLWTIFRKFIFKISKFVWPGKYESRWAAAQFTAFHFPIWLVIGWIVVWIFFCSSLFSLWETTWSYFDAFYFFVVSLSTVGLGDVTPKHPKYMICNFPLVIIGLTLVTLVINLIQNKIEATKEKMTELIESQFGLDIIDETESESEHNGNHEPKTDREIPLSPTRQDSQPIRSNLGIIQTISWSKQNLTDPDKAKALRVLQVMRPRACRRRCGVQTEESLLCPCIKDKFSAETTILSSMDKNVDGDAMLEDMA